MPDLAILKQAFKGLRRDWRAGELRLIASAIVIAVASLSTVNFFTDRVRQATEIQATELLAADLVLRSSRPIDEALLGQAERGRTGEIAMCRPERKLRSGEWNKPLERPSWPMTTRFGRDRPIPAPSCRPQVPLWFA